MATTLQDLLPTLAKLARARDQRHSLVDLAKQAGASPSTFQRAFARIVGESAKQFSRRLQLEWAALALVASSRSVLDVALDAGFDSHEGFTRAFSRHFGMPPKQFRSQYAYLGNDEVHLALVDHLGPCIGLFRAPLSNDKHKDNSMNYDITRQSIDEAVFLYKQSRCAHADIAHTLGQLLPAVFQHAMKNGLELRSPPTTVYLEWGPGMVTLRAGMCVAAAEPTADFGVETWPATEAAMTIHTGSYDGLGDAHAAVDLYIAEHGLTKVGPAREIYLTDPGEVPNSDEWKTQLVWPIGG